MNQTDLVMLLKKHPDKITALELDLERRIKEGFPQWNTSRWIGWPIDAGERPIISVGGISGGGRSWKFTELINGLILGNERIVLTDFSEHPNDSCDRVLRRISDAIWLNPYHDLFKDYDYDKELETVTLTVSASVIGRAIPGRGHFLTAVVENVNDYEVARHLIHEANISWRRWGLRLIMSVPSFHFIAALESHNAYVLTPRPKSEVKARYINSWISDDIGYDVREEEYLSFWLE